MLTRSNYRRFAVLAGALLVVATGCGEGLEEGSSPFDGELRTVKQAMNDKPVLDLDGDGGDATFAATFTEGTAVNCTDSDATLTDEDNSTEMNRLTAQNKTLTDGGVLEVLDADVTGTNISKSYNTGDGKLTLSGVDSIGNYEQVLRTVTFNHTGENPTTGDRDIEFEARDTDDHKSVKVSATITVAAVNDAPEWTVPNDQRVDQETNLTVAGISVADVDVDDGDLKINLSVSDGILTLAQTTNLVFNAGSDGSASMEFTGEIDDVNAALNDLVYLGDNGFSGDDTITLVVDDQGNTGGAAETDNATITVTVNDAPVAVADPNHTVDEDNTLNVNAAAGVLTNDTDTEDDDMTAVLDTDVTNGSLTLNSDGSFDYTPDQDFNGTDSFTYFANDGVNSAAAATVTITVNAVNDAPVAVADPNYTVDEDNTLNINEAAGVITNDTDVDGDGMTAVLDTDVSNGSLTLNSDGSFDYTPDQDFEGTDSFTYFANDGTVNSDAAATVTITVNAVNDAPTATADAYSVDEDNTLNVNAAAGVLDNNDNDVDGDTLTAVLDTDVSNGSLTLNSDGSFDYTPDQDFNGTDSFTYHANDTQADSNTVTVTITVNAVNDAPVAVADPNYTVDEDNTLNVNEAAGVITNDTDVDGDGMTAVLDTDVSNGSLTLNSDGSFDYTPDQDFEGTDSFTYFANDGTVNSDAAATVTITVNAVNDAPVAVADPNYTVDEDNTLNINEAAGVITNDTDVDGDGMTAVLDTDVSNGSLTLNSDGSFDYTPDQDFEGTDSFTYFANDGTVNSDAAATVTITVNAVNDAPVAVADPNYTVDEDNTLNINEAAGVLTNDTDTEDDDLTAVLDTDVSNGSLTLNSDGSFDYTPDQDFEGTDSFTYFANDGTVNSDAAATVTITVNAVNDAPTATADNYSVDEGGSLTINAAAGVLPNDNDVDEDDLTAVLDTDVTDGTLNLNSDGSFTYTPDDNFNGTDSFTYFANDGTVNSDAAATVTITVNAVNDAPTATADAYSVNEDNTLTRNAAQGVLANDDDVDGDNLTAVLDTNVTDGTLNLNSDGSFTYTPDDDFNGEDSFSYHANDTQVDSNTVTVTITVNAVNDEPVAAADAYSVDEDGTLTINAGLGVLNNDNDVDGDNLTAVLDTDVSDGTLNLNANGSFTYSPDQDFEGQDSFTYHANDGDADSNTTQVTITVNAINDRPVIDTLAGDQVGNEGSSFSFNAAASDVEGDTLTYTWNFGDGSNEVTGVNLTNVSHTYDQDASRTVTLTVTDSQLQVQNTLAVTVNNVAPQDVNAGTPAQVNEGANFTFSGSANDPSPIDNAALEFCWDYGDGTDEECGVGLTNPQHVFDDNGIFTVTLTVSDDDDSTEATVQMFVNNVAPSADAGNNITANEGDEVQFNGEISDPSQADTALLTFEWDFGDGDTDDQDVTPTHIYRNEGVFQAELSVQDKDNAEDSDNILVTIRNVAPSINLGNNRTVAEGTPLTVTATVDDPGLDDTLDFTWSFGDGNGETDEVDEITHTYFAPGDYTLSLTVDDGQDETTESITVTVTNIQPATDTLVIPNAGDEGESLTFDVSATEPGTADPEDLTYTWNFGDGTIIADAGPGAQSHTYVDEGDGDYTVTLTIADGEGDATVITQDVDVTNLPPVANAGDNDSVDEGSAYTFAGSANDPGVEDVLTFSWDFRDGNTDAGINLTGPQNTFADNGQFDVRLTVSDGDGEDDQDTVRITVDNVNPSINLGNDRTIIQGTPFDFTATVTDPGENDDNDEELEYEWSVTCDTGRFNGCDQGFVFNSDESGEDLETVNLTFNNTFDQAGLYTLNLTVTDKDDGSDTQSININVQNEVPIVQVSLDNATINEGESVEITATAIDIGLDDLDVDIDFGDGQSDDNITHLPNNGQYADIVRNHTYAQDSDGDAFTVSVQATDEDGGQGTASVTLTVLNVAPQVTLNNFNGQEGVALTLSAGVTDVAADTERLVFSWTFGDGDTQTGDAGEDLSEVSHTYAQDGEYPLSLSVFDGTDTTTVNALVTIANVLPVVTFNNFNAQEGVPVQINADAVDVQADNLTFVWRFGDGSQEETTNVPTVTHTFPDNNNFTVRLTVQDDDGQTVETARGTVANVDPAVATIDDIIEDEGEEVVMNGLSVDVAADTQTYCWDFGDGSDEECGVDLTQVRHTYANDDARTVTLTVTDEDNGEGSTQFGVTFDNLDPSVSAGDNLQGQLEGTAVVFDGDAQDPGDDTLTYCWDFDDGSQQECGVDLRTPQHVYTDEGTFQVELTVTDGEGGEAVDFVRVEVGNVSPQVTIDPQEPANEGDRITFTAEAIDPGFDEVQFCWRFGDGGGEECFTPDDQDVTEDIYRHSVTHVYRDNGVFTVNLRVVDEDGGQGTDAIDIRINNVAPSINCNPPTQAQTAVEYLFDIEVEDPGADDELTFTLIDGHPDTAIDNDGQLTFTPEELDGTFAFEVRVTDDDGAFDSCQWEVEIGFEDSDGDGAPDVCEDQFECLDSNNPDDGGADFDLDGITSAEECLRLELTVNPRGPCESDAPDPAPSVHQPVDGDIVGDAQVDLVINNTFDPNNDPLRYVFELYSDRELNQLVEELDVPQGQPRTQARVTEELDENGVYCWRARATDGNGFSGFSDVSCFVFSLVPEPPSIPQAQEPNGVARTLTPNFTWRNSEDPEGEDITYSLEVLNEANEVVFSAGNIEPGDGNTTTFGDIPDDRLADNETYTWRIQAVDSAQDGEVQRSETSELTFFVDIASLPPVAGEFIFPNPNFVLDNAAEFMAVAEEAFDEEGDDIFYDFRINPQGDDQTVLFTQNGVQATGQVVVLEADLSEVDFVEDTVYEVILVARDDDGLSEPVRLPFVFSANNEPPGVVTLQSPSNGEQVDTVQPTFVWRNTTDIEGDAFTYDLEVSLVDFDEVAFEISGLVPDGGDETSFVGAVLPEDLRLSWKVRGVDERGGTGQWSEPAAFVVNVANQRPGAPVLIEPIDRVVLDDGAAVSFSWEDSVDPEGDAIVYQLEVFGADGLPVSAALEVNPSDDDTGVTTFEFTSTLDPGGYSWRVRAQAGGALSQFSNSGAFSVAQPEVEEPDLPESCSDFVDLGLDPPDFCLGELEDAVFPDPVGDCACVQAPAAPARTPILWLALGALGLAVLRLRRER